MQSRKIQSFWMTALLWLSGALQAQLHLALEARQVENFGVRTVNLQSTHAAVEQLSEARVLDASLLYSQISEIDRNTSNLAFSSAQLASITRLFQNQQNASRSALAQASLLMRTDQNNLARAQMAVQTTWGDQVARWSTSERSIRMAQLRTSSASLLRLELSNKANKSTRFSTPDATLEWLGMLPNADPQTGRTGALLWLKPGAPVQSRLQVQIADSTDAKLVTKVSLLIPRAAVLRINGGYFVFVETSAPQTALRTFEMRELIAPARSPEGWLVQTGFKAGENIVNAGAASLLTMARGAGAEE